MSGFAAQDPCGRAKESLTVCMSFVTDLTFVSVPGVLSQVMGGRSGFVLLSKIFADTAKRIYSVVRRHCCPDSSDPTLLFKRLEYVTALIGGRDYTARATVERLGDGSIALDFTGLQHMRNGDPLYAAPIAGIIAGMIEAMGHKARVLSGRGDVVHAELDAYKVYVDRVEPGSVRIIVVPPTRARA